MTPEASTTADIIAEALAAHDGHGDKEYDDFYACACGEWDTDIVSYDERKAAHVAHQASAVDARLVQAGHTMVPTSEREDLLDRLRSIVDNFVSGDVVDELRELIAAAAPATTKEKP